MGNKKSSSKKKSKINQQTDVSTAKVVDTMARAKSHRSNDDGNPPARGRSQRNDDGNNPPTTAESRNQAPSNDTGHTGASGIPPDRRRSTPVNVTSSTVDSGSGTPVAANSPNVPERSAEVVNNDNNTEENSEPNSTCVPIGRDDSIGRDENAGNEQASFHDQRSDLARELHNTLLKYNSSNMFPGMKLSEMTPEQMIDNLTTGLSRAAPLPSNSRNVDTSTDLSVSMVTSAIRSFSTDPT